MNRLKRTITTVFILASFIGYSQDTISIMYYNLLNFPNVNSARINYLTTVLQYVKPDILVVCELTSQTGANTILNSALNTGGITYYAAANYVDGPDTENMLYYNTNKVGLLSQSEIATSLRDFNEYVLYYKNPNLTASSDTAYFYVYGAHLKAGNTVSDENDRTAETTILKSYLNTRPFAENTIVGGDMNIYYSTEGAYNNLTATNQANLYDPIGAGSYHNNALYANQFTQSTRVDAFDGGSTGGMDDRFDYILFSDDVVTGDNGVRFIPSSYRAIGQDGLRWNASLINPVNNSEPAAIINALYYMSDHIPVYMEMEVGGELGLSESLVSLEVYPNPVNETIYISCDSEMISYSLADAMGRILIDGALHGEQSSIDVSGVEPGLYYLNIHTHKGLLNKQLIIR